MTQTDLTKTTRLWVENFRFYCNWQIFSTEKNALSIVVYYLHEN